MWSMADKKLRLPVPTPGQDMGEPLKGNKRKGLSAHRGEEGT
jgi:hypothetical protein